MNASTIAILLVLVIIVYIVMTYRQLRFQYKRLNDIALSIKNKNEKSENTDYQRREHNKVARSYNHKLSSFIGKIIAKRLSYIEVEIIEKHN